MCIYVFVPASCTVMQLVCKGMGKKEGERGWVAVRLYMNGEYRYERNGLDYGREGEEPLEEKG